MKPITILFGLTVALICLTKGINGQQGVKSNNALNAKQQSIVTISAFTAKGDLTQLQKSLNEGLDAGLTINEIKEVLLQLYAYTGFPRSLNALNTFMAVLKERKAKGITDPPGKEPSPLPTDKSRLAFGTEMRTKLVGRPVTGEVYQFAPAIDQFLAEHLFGAIFGRDNLDWKTRELATIAALASLGGVDAQLRSHFGVGMHNGLTAAELNHAVSIIQSRVGTKEGNTAIRVLQMVLKPDEVTTQVINDQSSSQDLIYPKGQKVTNNNFTGNVWLQNVIAGDSSNLNNVGNVTFEAGARTNWHLHPGGQILLVTSGTGYYQEKGSPKRIIRKGDSIKCPPNVQHWHGASKESGMTHLSITNNQRGAAVWLQPVTDAEYDASK